MKTHGIGNPNQIVTVVNTDFLCGRTVLSSSHRLPQHCHGAGDLGGNGLSKVLLIILMMKMVRDQSTRLFHLARSAKKKTEEHLCGIMLLLFPVYR